MTTFWAPSKDGGKYLPDPPAGHHLYVKLVHRVSTVRPNFGDYIGSATGGNHVFPVWGDGRNDVPGTFYATLQGAGKSKEW